MRCRDDVFDDGRQEEIFIFLLLFFVNATSYLILCNAEILL